MAEVLRRYASPADVAKALRAAQVRIDSGELKRALPKNATPEDLAEFRKSNGIPEKPTDYDINLGNGVTVGEQDRALIDQYFLKAAHESHQTPDQVKATLKSYYAMEEARTAARHEQDKQQQEAAERELIGEWGAELRGNINRIRQLLDSVSPADMDLADLVLNGRLADGTPIGSHPATLKALLGIELMRNPAGIVGVAGGGPAGVDDEIASIEKTMRTNRAAYNKDEKMQERYRSLLDAREKLRSQHKAA